MAILLGPVLQCLGIQDKRCCASGVVLTDTATAPALQCASPQRIRDAPARRLWVNGWMENEAEPGNKVIHPVR